MPPSPQSCADRRIVSAPDWHGVSYASWSDIPPGVASSNAWRRLHRRRPRADAAPVARVACDWTDRNWHPLYDHAGTEPTRRADQAAAGLPPPDAMDMSEFVRALPPPTGGRP